MQYMGSKSRLSKELLPIILKDVQGDYVEPFAGGMNMIDKVLINGDRRANEINPYLIALFEAVTNGWVPKDHYTKEEYNAAKSLDGELHEIGYMGFCCSFGGKWFGGWINHHSQLRKDGSVPNRQIMAKNSLLRQAKKLQGVIFSHGDYRKMFIPEGSTVYCDPPYKGTTSYKDDFDHVAFWEWVRLLSSSCKVFVSEYSAPEDMTEIWSKELSVKVSASSNKNKNVEKLFVYNNQS